MYITAASSIYQTIFMYNTYLYTIYSPRLETMYDHCTVYSMYEVFLPEIIATVISPISDQLRCKNPNIKARNQHRYLSC